MLELRRRGQIESCTWRNSGFIVDVSLGEGRRKVYAGASLSCRSDRSRGDRLPVRGRANCDLISYSETARVSHLDVRRARARICRKSGVVCLRTDARDGDSLDAVAHAVDIQPDLVTNRN